MIMLGLKLNQDKAGAAIACLLALAMVVGPLCMPMCASTECLQRGASSSEEASCHGMSEHGVSQMALAPSDRPCQLAETGIAVLSKLTLATKTAFDKSASPIFTANSTIANPSAASTHAIFSSTGPPQGVPSPSSTNPVLRV
jgi:hypothetical protein